MIDLTKESVTVVAPGKGICELCDGKLDLIASVQIQYKVLFKTFKKRACLPCVKEVRALADLRIAQAERGEFGS